MGGVVTDTMDRIGFIMEGVLRVVYYRSLHMVSVPFTPSLVLAYAQENAAGGRFGGRVTQLRSGWFFTVWLWEGINLGRDVTMDMYIWGARKGAQTVLVRKQFWLGNFSARTLRPHESLAIFEAPDDGPHAHD